MSDQIYLSRRNLLTLLNKLDRKKGGGNTGCTILKGDNKHPVFPQSMAVCLVTALEDDEYYVDRVPGVVMDTPE